MKKLIIAIGIIAAILAILIPFRAKSQLTAIVRSLNINTSITIGMAFENHTRKL